MKHMVFTANFKVQCVKLKILLPNFKGKVLATTTAVFLFYHEFHRVFFFLTVMFELKHQAYFIVYYVILYFLFK